MFGFVAAIGCLFVGALGYGIGKIHGWDQWDKENEEFQKGLKRNG